MKTIIQILILLLFTSSIYAQEDLQTGITGDELIDFFKQAKGYQSGNNQKLEYIQHLNGTPYFKIDNSLNIYNLKKIYGDKMKDIDKNNSKSFGYFTLPDFVKMPTIDCNAYGLKTSSSTGCRSEYSVSLNQIEKKTGNILTQEARKSNFIEARKTCYAKPGGTWIASKGLKDENNNPIKAGTCVEVNEANSTGDTGTDEFITSEVNSMADNFKSSKIKFNLQEYFNTHNEIKSGFGNNAAGRRDFNNYINNSIDSKPGITSTLSSSDLLVNKEQLLGRIDKIGLINKITSIDKKTAGFNIKKGKIALKTYVEMASTCEQVNAKLSKRSKSGSSTSGNSKVYYVESCKDHIKTYKIEPSIEENVSIDNKKISLGTDEKSKINYRYSCDKIDDWESTKKKIISAGETAYSSYISKGYKLVIHNIKITKASSSAIRNDKCDGAKKSWSWFKSDNLSEEQKAQKLLELSKARVLALYNKLQDFKSEYPKVSISGKSAPTIISGPPAPASEPGYHGPKYLSGKAIAYGHSHRNSLTKGYPKYQYVKYDVEYGVEKKTVTTTKKPGLCFGGCYQIYLSENKGSSYKPPRTPGKPLIRIGRNKLKGVQFKGPVTLSCPKW